MIAIIAILASLLLPTLGRAKEKVRTIQCLNNVRQQAISWKISVDLDEGHFVHRDVDDIASVERFKQSGMAQWIRNEWGFPNKASICPAAPVLQEQDRPRHSNYGYEYPEIVYPGATHAAWVFKYPYNGYFFSNDPRAAISAEPRVGSYALNTWFGGPQYRDRDSVPWARRPDAFHTESHVANPSLTPLFADGLHWWGVGPAHAGGPLATDLPAWNLVSGGTPMPPWSMAIFTLPRHGSKSSKISTNHAARMKLPGAINVVFYDGHAGQVKLEGLWQLYWHRDYQPPAKRPGL